MKYSWKGCKDRNRRQEHLLGTTHLVLTELLLISPINVPPLTAAFIPKKAS